MAEWRQRAEYDVDANSIYVYLNEAPTARTVPVDDCRNVDYSADGAVVGVEFLDIEARVDLHDIPFSQRVESLIGDPGVGAQDLRLNLARLDHRRTLSRVHRQGESLPERGCAGR